MGFGANMAHGCNIGLGLAGIPTLSLGSMLAVACMAIGALAVRGRPRDCASGHLFHRSVSSHCQATTAGCSIGLPRAPHFGTPPSVT